jgi:hypothetical protein
MEKLTDASFGLINNDVQPFLEKAHFFYRLAITGSVVLTLLVILLSVIKRKKGKPVKKTLIIGFIIILLYFVILTVIGYSYQEATFRM